MKWFGATLVFFAELGMLAGLAWWGFHAADGVAAWLLAVALPSVAVTLWGQFLAPKAPRRLKGIMLPFMRLNVLLLGALAAYLAGAVALGLATAVCAIIGTAMAGDLVTTPPARV
ncbi:YrdB family protein [Demequina lutea]|uniref:DUF2568 domain-containing protein n=1 Tax=Demequina lutea TaxID=431489 RepID=A0A7Y9Z8P4_9MICO|nr:YrdB family protein [Demequina lutea]NYI40872.1 hypothetical protein [Demequina lutea]